MPTAPSSTTSTTTTVTGTASSPSLRPVATTAAEQAETTTTFSRAVDTPTEAVTELLSADTPEEIQQAITAIADNIDQLTPTELDAIAKAVSNAPTDIKKEFENQVNIFGGGLDNYVPADSNVTVAQRRVLVAIGAILTATPILTSRKR